MNAKNDHILEAKALAFLDHVEGKRFVLTDVEPELRNSYHDPGLPD